MIASTDRKSRRKVTLLSLFLRDNFLAPFMPLTERIVPTYLGHVLIAMPPEEEEEDTATPYTGRDLTSAHGVQVDLSVLINAEFNHELRVSGKSCSPPAKIKTLSSDKTSEKVISLFSVFSCMPATRMIDSLRDEICDYFSLRSLLFAFDYEPCFVMTCLEPTFTPYIDPSHHKRENSLQLQSQRQQQLRHQQKQANRKAVQTTIPKVRAYRYASRGRNKKKQKNGPKVK